MIYDFMEKKHIEGFRSLLSTPVEVSEPLQNNQIHIC